MSTNATSLLLPGSWAGARGTSAADEEVHAWRARVGVALLVAMIGVSVFVVIIAADRPSFLVPPSAQHYFPRWLAGPLGGLWPSFSRSTRVLDYVFTYGVLSMYVAYVAFLGLARHVRARWVIGAVVVLHLVLFVAPPLALTDVFNYLNYGRMEIVHHLNPYATIPILEPHDDPTFAMSNWHHLLSPYGPMFTILTFAFVPLGVAASFWAMKAILMLSSLGTLLLVWRCARLLGRDPVRAIAFVGLNPVVLLWGLGGDHNDFITVFFIVLAFYLLLRSRAAAAAVGELAPEQAPGARAQAPVAGLVAGSGAAGAVGAVGAVGADRARPAPVAPVAAVTPAVAGTPLGFAADSGVALPVSRWSPAAWLARTLDLAGARVGALRPRARAADRAVSAPPPHPVAVTPELAAVNGTGPGSPGEPRRRFPITPEFFAGVALIVAATMKASAAILIPVLLLSLVWSRRRVLQFVLGMVLTAITAAAVTYVAFGPHIPDLSTQDKLITAESIPNLLGLLLGQGGETDVLRRIVQGTLLLSVAWGSWWAWRRREFITPAAWVTAALIATLSWVLPWYVLWLLPLAALAGTRALQRVALAVGVYMILVWAPLAGSWYAAVHFAPTKTALGKAHQRETKFFLH